MKMNVVEFQGDLDLSELVGLELYRYLYPRAFD
jgi:hypothetical protein